MCINIYIYIYIYIYICKWACIKRQWDLFLISNVTRQLKINLSTDKKS